MKYRELLEACWKGYHKEGMKTMFGKRYPNCVKNKKTNEEQRIPRKPGQPANSKKHSDLYTDENPKGTIQGLKFATAEDAKASVSKIRNSGKSHAHKIQAAVAMEQRAKAAGKTEAASVYRKFINSIKKTNEEQLDEKCWDGYQQQGMKKKGSRQVPNCVKMSESELEEDLKKWFREKWVRFGPDGKIRGECGGRDGGEGKPKCLPASKAHSLGKKGRASSAAKKRREDPNPERRGPAKNVATKTRGMKEQGIPELQPPQDQQQEPSALRKGLDALGTIFTAGKLLQDPKALVHQELGNVIDPNRQNQSLIRRIFPGDKNQQP